MRGVYTIDGGETIRVNAGLAAMGAGAGNAPEEVCIAADDQISGNRFCELCALVMTGYNAG